MISMFAAPTGLSLIVLASLAGLAQADNVTAAGTPTFTSITTTRSSVVCATIAYTANTTLPIASTGTGSVYASSCSSISSSYLSAQSSYEAKYAYTATTTYTYGGTLYSTFTSYLNASTLCDGHARVNYSPAIPIATRSTTTTQTPTSTQTITQRGSCGYRPSQPYCFINPDDCDGLWAAYSSSVANLPPYPTLLPQKPFCANSSQALINSAISSEVYGCGPCTMYGVGVQLVFFPPPATATRDMCAGLPTASLTHYGPGAVITAYTGTDYRDPSPNTGQHTVVADGHTFTSGTAYISIATVYAKKRCTTDPGYSVYDAVLAMPSQSVLSLRYSQDHFQHFMETDQQTGYPVNYADFRTPIPWSAWNGQSRCQGYGDNYRCGIIYENEFRPQLAIPPGIRDLHPSFEGCQLFYGGLYDPPLALTEADAAASATLPTYLPTTATPTSAAQVMTTPASPSSVATLPTATGTALADNVPSSGGGGSSNSGTGSDGGSSQHEGGSSSGGQQQNGGSQQQNGGSSSNNGGSSSNNGGNSDTDSQNAEGGSNGGNAQNNGGVHTGAQSAPTIAAKIFLVTLDGQTRTATQSSAGGPIYISTFTLTPGGSATTLLGGKSISAVSNGLIIDRTSFVGATGAAVTNLPSRHSDTGSPPTTTTSAAAATRHSSLLGIWRSIFVLSFFFFLA